MEKQSNNLFFQIQEDSHDYNYKLILEEDQIIKNNSMNCIFGINNLWMYFKNFFIETKIKKPKED